MRQVLATVILLGCLSSGQAFGETSRIKGEFLAEQAKSYVLDKLKQKDVDVQVEVVQPPQDIVLTTNLVEWNFKLDSIPDHSQLISVPIKITRNNHPYKTSSVLLKASYFSDVLVPVRKIAKHQKLNAEDFKTVRTELTTNFNNYLKTKNDLTGLWAQQNISPGAPLVKKLVEVIPVIKQGDVVEIKNNLEGIKLVARGVALVNGYVGDKIRVANVDTRREFLAQVSAEGSVEVVNKEQ